MKMLHCTGLYICFASGLIAQTVEGPKDLPPALQDFVAQTADRCETGDVARFPEEAFSRPYDFNQDGEQDFIVYGTYLRCIPLGNTMYGGTGGEHYWVFISEPGGDFREALHETAHAMQTVRFFRADNVPALVFFKHGSACGYGSMRRRASLGPRDR